MTPANKKAFINFIDRMSASGANAAVCEAVKRGFALCEAVAKRDPKDYYGMGDIFEIHGTVDEDGEIHFSGTSSRTKEYDRPVSLNFFRNKMKRNNASGIRFDSATLAESPTGDAIGYITMYEDPVLVMWVPVSNTREVQHFQKTDGWDNDDDSYSYTISANEPKTDDYYGLSPEQQHIVRTLTRGEEERGLSSHYGEPVANIIQAIKENPDLASADYNRIKTIMHWGGNNIALADAIKVYRNHPEMKQSNFNDWYKITDWVETEVSADNIHEDTTAEHYAERQAERGAEAAYLNSMYGG